MDRIYTNAESSAGSWRWQRSNRALALLLVATFAAVTVVVGLPLRAHASSAPVVYAVIPNTGPTQGGTAVTIYGSGFTNATGVNFGSSSASCSGSSGFFVVSDTQIFATTPANSAGTIDVVVVGPGGTSPTGPADKFTYASPAVAVVNGISPSSGTTGGGTEVTLHGSGFSTATAVMFGSTRMPAYPASDTTLFVSSPAETAGTVDVIVVNPAGPSAAGNADKFTYVAPGGPVVQALSPNHGLAPGGTQVVIVGTGFINATAVHFGAAALSPGGFGIVDDSHIVVDATPAGTAATTVDVTVTTAVGTSAGTAGDRFSYLAATRPVINGVVVNSGPAIGGTVVEIIGSGFTGASSVMFGTHTGAGVSVGDDTALLVTTPAVPVGTVDITITTPVGTSAIVAADKFTFQALSAPVIYGVSPHTGITSGNTQVTIYGSGFVSGSTVRFGSNAASNVQAFDTTLFVQSPAGSTGTVDITITNPAGTSAAGLTDRFTYVAPGAPLVQAVNPNRGFASGGNSINIIGTGFTGTTSVQFGTAASTIFSVIDDTQLYVSSPAGTSGTTVDITVTTPVGTSTASNADKFTYFTPAAPTVTAVSPAGGPASGGTTVWVTGTGFAAVSAVNFGTSAASVFQTQSDTVIEIVGSPAGTSGATVDITVVTSGGTSAVTTADHFTYTAPVAPVIHAVSPSSGPANGNTTVYITGTGLSGVSAVNFGAAASPSFFVQTDGTVITASSPAGTNGATVDIRVVTPGGTSAITTNDQFAYIAAVTPPAPTVSAVSPSSGPATGGTTVYVSGSYLTGATQVSFGGVATASFGVLGDNLLQAVSPSGTAGTTVDVTVTTSSGGSATGSADRFTYTTTPVPVVTGVSPATGPSAGTTGVFITGSGFDGLTGVSFGANASTTAYSLSDTLAYSISPAGTGTVDITVTTGGGTSATSANDRFVYGGPNPSGLQVNGITSNAGPTAGGTSVQIYGMGFTGATGVSFGTTPAQSFFVSGDGNIYAVSPTGSAGRVDVTVSVGASTSATTPTDSFTYQAPGRPVVNALAPNRGPQGGGTSITIYGSDLSGVTAVHFGSSVATSYFSYYGDSTQVIATSPSGVGTVDVTVTTPAGTSAISPADTFTYLAPGPPVVNAVDPASGSSFGQSGIVLFGSGFSGATAVSFGTTPAFTFFPSSDTELFVTSPAGTAGTTVDITVTTPVGTSAVSNADKFTYLAPPVPAVNAVTPGRGGTNGGSTISLFGSGFSGVTAVHFGTTLAGTFSDISDDMIDVTSPAGALGTVDITVTAPGGVSSVNPGDRFTYYLAPGPTVTAVSPSSGRPGTLVYVTGTGLADATAVLFGSACVPFYLTYNATDTSISINAPAGVAGTVDVRVITPDGTSAVTAGDKFTYLAPTLPSITAVSPASGYSVGGTDVFITGTGLAGVTSVSFGSTQITGVFAIDDGLLDVSSPAGVAGSTVDIRVTTPGGTSAASSADRFTWGPTPVPSVSVVSPNSGPSGGGSGVLVTGSGYSNVTQMQFGSTVLHRCGFGFGFGFGAGTTSAATPIVSQPNVAPSTRTTVATRLPIHHSTKSARTTATAPTFTTVLSPSEPVLLKPAAKSATPSSVSSPDAFGGPGLCLAGFIVLGDNLAKIISPAQGSMATTVDITATSGGGTSATSAADQFTYTPTPAPAVTAVSPSTGRSAGGTTVYISGSNLTNPGTVNFGSAAATIVPLPFFFGELAGDSLIAVTSPAGTNPSTVDVTVTTAGGTSPLSTADHFTYGPTPVPTVVAVGPGTGPIGSTVYITGTGFSGATAVNFGGTSGQGVSVISDTLIQVVSPTHAVGTVDVQVVTPGGTSATNSSDKYTYTTAPVPVVTAIGPNSGSPGTTVYINGTGFTGASVVSFGGTSAGFLVLSDNLIAATSPAGTGTVDIKVTAPGGTSAASANDLWTFGLPLPTVTSLVPSSGPAAGGTSVTITGTGFAGATGVTFGVAAATGFAVVNATTITATSPAGTGTVDVTITTPSGTSLVAAGDRFSYGTPSAPTGVRAVAGDTEASLTWTPPAAGAPITGYTVTASPGGATATVSAVVPAATITGLSNGTAYSFTVTASNAVGSGPASAASPAVTPVAVTQGPSVAVLPAMSNGAYGGYLTTAYVENVSSSAAHVRVQYFDTSGHGVGFGNSAAGLAPGATWTLRTDNGDSLAATQAGSAVVYSDQPLAVFVNEFAPGNSSDATSYTTIRVAGGTGGTLFAPAIANNAYGGYTTGIGLVSLASGPSTITVTYRDSAGAVIKTQTLSAVAAGAYQGLYSGDPTLGLPNGFAGTATITSSAGNLAAVVNETGPGGQFSSYDAVAAGSATLYAPAALNNAYGGYNTGMGIQNTTATGGTVTITYYDALGSPTVKSFPIVANGYVGVYQGTDIPVAGAYTAKITSTVAIAAIVNEVAPSATSALQSTAYNTFGAGSSSLHLPLVESTGADGWSTGEGIMNTGTAATTVTVTYYDPVSGAPVGTAQSLSLQPNAFWGLYQPAGGLPSGARASAVVTTTAGGQVAVICNESNATSFMSYIGI